MIKRIEENEKRLDSLLESVKELEQALEDFKSKKKDLKELKKYYGSKNWLKDKEAYEQNKIPKIKAGVLSEDAVWNLLENIDELKKEMNAIKKDLK
jgi:uncharacterized protein YoxC